MPFNYNKNNKRNAQRLRKSMTPEEKKLWYDFLRKLPCTVNRQKMIGQYIIDFYCHSAMLAIEIDGAQHRETEGMEEDAVRDEFLLENGIKVLRYTNQEVNNRFEFVKSDISRNIEERLFHN